MMRSWPILLVLGSLLAMPFTATGQEGAPSISEDPGTATLSDSMNGASRIGPWGGYLYFRKNFDNGVGYRNGFTNLGWFQPFQFSDDSAFFGQGNLFVTDDGQVGGNIGGGFRSYAPNTNSVMGVYGFFDFDESVNGNRYDQFSLGAEFRGQRMDMTANLYLPFNQNERNFLALRSLNGPLVLSGRNLFFTGAALFEKPMTGGDFEVGFPVLDPSALGRVRGYLGVYGYDSPAKDPIGLRARVEAHINQYATVGGAVMHDDANGAFATFAVELRGWNRRLPELAHNNDYNRAKMYLPVTRQYRVAVDQYTTRDFQTPALGADGTPIDFVWVNNGNDAPGSGTFEDPYHDMPATAPGADYILVYQGPSSTANPVLGGITLQNGQRLYGEGFEFFIDVAGTAFGPNPQVLSIQDIEPAWNTSGQHPFVSNPGGNFVTLADDNEVGGFNIISTLGHGVTGTGINNFTLFDLNIGHPNPAFGNGGAGVFLTDASGIGSIDNFTLMNNAGGGLRIQNTGAADLLLDVNGNTTVDPNVTGGLVGLELIANNSNITATVNDFLNSGSSAGAFLAATNTGSLDLDIQDSAFNDTTAGDGMRVEADGGAVMLALTDTTATGSAGDGLDIRVNNDGVFSGSVAGTNLGDSSFSDAAANGVNLIVDGSASPFNLLTFSQTTINGSGEDGLHIELTDGSYFDVRFLDGTIVGSGGDAIDDFEDGASTLDLLVDPSLLTDSGENGFLFNVINNSILNATFIDTDLSRSGQAAVLGAGNGIHGILDTGGVANLTLTNPVITQSGEHGLFIEAMGASTFNGTLDNGDLSDSNQSGGAFDGINFVVDGAGTVATLDVTDTLVDNTFLGGGMQMNALDFLVDNSGSFSFSAIDTGSEVTNSSSFSNALADGVFGRTHNGGTADVTFDATPIDNSGDDGFDLLADTASSLTATLQNGSSASNSSANGVLAEASDTNTTLQLIVDASTVDGNLADGLNLTANSDATLEADVVNGSSVSNNLNNGIVADATNAGTTANLAVVSSTVDNNITGSGLDLTVTDDAALNGLLVDSSASFNGLDGTRLLVDGAGATTPLATLVVDGFLTDGNGEDGWDVTVQGGGQLDADFSGITGPSSSSGNGEDGFELLVDGAGTFADIDMADFAADGNGVSPALGDGNGFNITVQNDAELALDMTGGVSGSDNQLNGFLLNATGANTVVRVNMTDTNQFDNNGLEDPPGGYGILVNATGIATLEAVVGGGSGNTLGGVEINVDGMNATTVESVGVAGPVNIDGNTGNGLLINLLDVPDVQNISITEASVSNNTGFGVIVQANSSPIQEIFVGDNLINGNLGGDGLLFDLLNSAVSGTLEVNNNGVSNNAGNGINFELDNSAINTLNILNNGAGGGGALVGLDFSIVGNTFGQPYVITNTSQPGFDITGFSLDFAPTIALNPPGIEWDTIEPGASIPFLPLLGSDVTTGLTMINGTAVVPPIVPAGGTDTMDNVGTTLPGGGVPDMQGILDLVFSDFNPGETFTWEADVDVIGAGASTVLGSDLVGTDITVNFTGGLFLAGTLQPFGIDGSQFVATSGAIATPVSGNAGDGIRINQTNGSDITNLDISGNIIDDNGQHGIEFLVDNSTLPGPGNPVTVTGNTITNHANGDGVNLVLPNTTGGADIGMNFVDNDISGNVSGIHVEIDDNTGQFVSDSSGNTVDNNASFGLRMVSHQDSDFDLTFDGGSFSGNGDAGVGISLNDTSSGRVTVQNATISDNVDGPALDFDGQGIHVRVNDDADLLGGTIFADNMITGNAAAGIEVFADGTTTVGTITIDGNTLDDNADAGIRFERVADGHVIGPVTISNNTITGGADGIELIARNENNTDSYDLIDNMILDVAGTGVLLEQGFDARQDVDMSGNVIDGSGSDGIHAFQTAGTISSELRRLFGTWQNNTVTNNGGNGMFLESRLAGLSVLNNVMSENGGAGLLVTGPGTMSATLNLVEMNGGGGIYVQGPGFKTMSFNGNTIRSNTGDGFRLINNGNAFPFSFNITASSNIIELNTERGMNVLNQGTADTTLNMSNNLINLNQREGVYVVNTSSTSQSAAFGAALLANGSVNAVPRLNLTFNSNTVTGNGNSGTTVSTGGFALRVGTSDGGNSFTDMGGFANSRGGVVANVSNNTFVGNAGNDVYFDSFTSTVDPNTTGGNWEDQNDNPRDPTNDVFNPTGYQSDPLARLDLTFNNNFGDEAAVNNTGAFYNNNEDEFKSRTRAQDGNDPNGPFPGAPDDDGPFGSGTRTRNAQRLAGRFGLPPTFLAGANFLFPGIGESTFRVSASGNSFASGGGFILDIDPYTNPATDAMGVPGTAPNGGPLGIDNMPWGWSTLP